MSGKLGVRLNSVFFCGALLGVLTSIIPILFWQKIALIKGAELQVDIPIVLFLIVGTWLYIRNSANIISALFESLIVILISAVITASAVIFMDSYNYQPITLALLLKGFPVSLIYGLPAYLVVSIYVKFLKRFER